MTVNRDLANYAQVSDQNPSFRNLIINGAMQVAQRGTSTASITTTAYYTADRWLVGITTMGTWTESVEADAPTGSGFAKSLKILCTTADASPAGGDRIYFDQRIEGQNLQAIKKGTANAEQLTLQFWVKSNVTGTYIIQLLDIDNSRTISKSYSVASSGTWEKKTIVFPADTTGAFDNDNALSLVVRIWLGSGTDFTSGTLNTTWNGSVSNTDIAVGQTNLASATNNYWQITGVQLEVGPVATSFEFKPYAQDLRECERYYQRVEGATGVTSNTTEFFAAAKFGVPLRAAPSAVSLTAAKEISDIYTANFTQSSASVSISGTATSHFAVLSFPNFTGLTQGRFYIFAAAGVTYVSAEL